MIEPTLIASLTADALSNITKNGFTEVAEKLTNRVVEAKKQYARLQADPEDSIEKLRINCLRRICSLQQETILYVSDADFLAKVLPLSLDLVGNVYEAHSESELEVLGMGISRLENALQAYKNEQKKRKRIRMLAVIIALINLLGIGVYIYFAHNAQVGINNKVAILMLPVPVLLWSILGSFAAILYRFTSAGYSELDEPLRWLFSRPLTGIVMGAISYLILKVGLISVQAGQAVDLGAMEVMWLVAFLAGFSDRFSDYLLKNVVGRFGGSTDGDLLTLEMSNKVTKNETNKYPFFNFFVSRKNGDNQTEGEIINPEKNTNGNSSKVNESSEIPGTENTVKTVSENTVKVVKTAEKDDK